VDNGADVVERAEREEKSRGDERLEPSRPANDDRQSVGQILLALQARPSAKPIVFATLASLAWVAVAGVYIWKGEAAAMTLGQWALFTLAALGPVAFFFSTAVIVRRAQEIRLTAQSMSQVAFRLAEPESLATEQIVTLSHAIRREVASMGDGIERALARASELETIMRAEVASLERTYSDNERRIRALIDELASEREAIVGNAEHLRQTIVGSQERLSSDIENASARLSDIVGEAGARVTSSLGEKAEEISMMLLRSGGSIVERIDSNGDQMTARLAETGSAVSDQNDRLEMTILVGRMVP